MLEILYEDNHIIAINKKTSDIVQADKSGDVPLSEEVKAYIKEKYNKPGEVFLWNPPPDRSSCQRSSSVRTDHQGFDTSE